MPKYKLSEESAQEQMEIFEDHYDLDLEIINDKSVKSAMKSSKDKIIQAIRLGRVEIKEENNELTIIQTLKNPPGDVTEIVYGEIKGRHKVAMDGKGDDTNYSKIYALLGALSGQGPKAFMSLKGADVSVAECLGALFLQI